MERLLKISAVAAMLSTTEGVAASILADAGVQPIDFGMGRSRGRRWLESAVYAVMRDMHDKAQPHARTVNKRVVPHLGMENMTEKQIYALTSGRVLQ